MSATYRTCKHIYDTGGTCNSAAVKAQHYCVYHLRHRARLMRMAQARARNQRLALRLPPLENMHAVHSALNQLAEAASAGMLDLKTARYLLSVVRAAGNFLLHANKWQANPYHSDQPAEVDLAAEYGLPNNLNLDTPPESAFPPPEPDVPSLAVASADGTGIRTDNWQPTTDNSSNDLEFSPTFPISPESVEVCEIYETQGPDAAQVRLDQLERNRARRQLRLDRKRHAEIALRRNIRIAAQRLAQRAAQPSAPAGASSASPVADRVGPTSPAKKPATSVNRDAASATARAKSSA